MRKHLHAIITTFIALYAAGLSTVVYLDQREAAKPRIVVSSTSDYGEDQDGNTVALFGVRAVNTGDESVWLDSVAYGWSAPMTFPLNFRVSEPIYGWSDINAIDRPAFPVELRPGRALVTWYDMQETIDYLEGVPHENAEKIHLQYTDETGREYRSQPESWERWKLINRIMQNGLTADYGPLYIGKMLKLDETETD